MSNVQVKRVPDELHAALRERAAQRSISLNDLLLEILHREVSRPTLADWAKSSRPAHAAEDVDIEELMDEVRGEPFPE